jgi:membrane-associated protease RseP (regulator of RpoE activity)
MLHPVAFAGWVGLFVTALNLLPIGQLDGGHINHALFGRHSQRVALVAFAVLAVMTFMYGYHYTLILFLLLFMGVKHPPTMNDFLELGPVRRRIGFGLWIVFALCFTPAPLKF